ncbi:putative aaa atpase [Anaeramoeba flamelloides]|uniref:Aaa atpase n=1 Tax=Anaeramoeba flamelloides TaxID=1746091 RepID=A0AAV8A4Q9_9EUKA|nr:putative aaa atpase [Anaeramoeba flamelloides]
MNLNYTQKNKKEPNTPYQQKKQNSNNLDPNKTSVENYYGLLFHLSPYPFQQNLRKVNYRIGSNPRCDIILNDSRISQLLAILKCDISSERVYLEVHGDQGILSCNYRKYLKGEKVVLTEGSVIIIYGDQLHSFLFVTKKHLNSLIMLQKMPRNYVPRDQNQNNVNPKKQLNSSFPISQINKQKEIRYQQYIETLFANSNKQNLTSWENIGYPINNFIREFIQKNISVELKRWEINNKINLGNHSNINFNQLLLIGPLGSQFLQKKIVESVANEFSMRLITVDLFELFPFLNNCHQQLMEKSINLYKKQQQQQQQQQQQRQQLQQQQQNPQKNQQKKILMQQNQRKNMTEKNQFIQKKPQTNNFLNNQKNFKLGDRIIFIGKNFKNYSRDNLISKLLKDGNFLKKRNFSKLKNKNNNNRNNNNNNSNNNSYDNNKNKIDFFLGPKPGSTGKIVIIFKNGQSNDQYIGIQFDENVEFGGSDLGGVCDSNLEHSGYFVRKSEIILENSVRFNDPFILFQQLFDTIIKKQKSNNMHKIKNEGKRKIEIEEETETETETEIETETETKNNENEKIKIENTNENEKEIKTESDQELKNNKEIPLLLFLPKFDELTLFNGELLKYLTNKIEEISKLNNIFIIGGVELSKPHENNNKIKKTLINKMNILYEKMRQNLYSENNYSILNNNDNQNNVNVNSNSKLNDKFKKNNSIMEQKGINRNKQKINKNGELIYFLSLLIENPICLKPPKPIQKWKKWQQCSENDHIEYIANKNLKLIFQICKKNKIQINFDLKLEPLLFSLQLYSTKEIEEIFKNAVLHRSEKNYLNSSSSTSSSSSLLSSSLSSPSSLSSSSSSSSSLSLGMGMDKVTHLELTDFVYSINLQRKIQKIPILNLQRKLNPLTKIEQNFYEQIKIEKENFNETFENIGGLEAIKSIIKEFLITPLKRPELFKKGNLKKISKGFLFFGPPGTGKTLITKAIANECGVTFLNISQGIINSKWYGQSEKNIEIIFSIAKKLAPSIIFLDEVDAVLDRRGKEPKEHETSRKIKTLFMQLWDGLKNNNNTSGGNRNNNSNNSNDDKNEFEQNNEQIIVIGATNRPHDLDEAVLRRFTKRIFIGLPDESQRLKILKILLKNSQLENNFDFPELAKITKGYSGSDLKNLVIAANYILVREQYEKDLDENSYNQNDQIVLRKLTLQDFKNAKKSSRSSNKIGSQELSNLLEWNKMYGGGVSNRDKTIPFYLF